MKELKINHLAVLVAIVLQFILGFLWYGPLFGEPWMGMVAGPSLGSDRLANSALRVQASCMGMGQAAGATAALACRQKSTPIDVPLKDIKKLIRQHGGIVP